MKSNNTIKLIAIPALVTLAAYTAYKAYKYMNPGHLNPNHYPIPVRRWKDLT